MRWGQEPTANSRKRITNHKHTIVIEVSISILAQSWTDLHFFVPGVEVFPRIFPHYARVGWGRVAWGFDCVKFPYGDSDLYLLYRILTILIRVEH